MELTDENKEDIIKYIKSCPMCYMYDIFDICRERHNDKMLSN